MDPKHLGMNIYGIPVVVSPHAPAGKSFLISTPASSSQFFHSMFPQQPNANGDLFDLGSMYPGQYFELSGVYENNEWAERNKPVGEFSISMIYDDSTYELFDLARKMAEMQNGPKFPLRLTRKEFREFTTSHISVGANTFQNIQYSGNTFEQVYLGGKKR